MDVSYQDAQAEGAGVAQLGSLPQGVQVYPKACVAQPQYLQVLNSFIGGVSVKLV